MRPRHPSTKPRVLITGGAGFLGSHLCDRFLSEGWEVLCLDNFFTGSKRNIAHNLSNPYFELIRHDITHPYFVEVDLILNFACPASPIHYQHNPIKTIKTSVLGMTNMLGLAKRLGCPILQASTSEVYGDPAEHPQTEEYWGNVNPIGIRSCYDEGKRVSETLCFDYHRQHNVDIRVVRIFNTYGPRMAVDDGRVVSNFIVQALQGKDITIYGDGVQSRSFCYYSDLIEAIFRYSTLESRLTGPINIGNDKEFTIRDLADQVTRLVGGSSKIVNQPLPLDDPKQRRPNLTLAKKHFAWAPKVELKDGLKDTVNYFREVLGN